MVGRAAARRAVVLPPGDDRPATEHGSVRATSVLRVRQSAPAQGGELSAFYPLAFQM
ncbi:hypothetical protein P3T18_002846 [Paraburkholderia sp. GAS199]